MPRPRPQPRRSSTNPSSRSAAPAMRSWRLHCCRTQARHATRGRARHRAWRDGGVGQHGQERAPGRVALQAAQDRVKHLERRELERRPRNCSRHRRAPWARLRACANSSRTLRRPRRPSTAWSPTRARNARSRSWRNPVSSCVPRSRRPTLTPRGGPRARRPARGYPARGRAGAQPESGARWGDPAAHPHRRGTRGGVRARPQDQRRAHARTMTGRSMPSSSAPATMP